MPISLNPYFSHISRFELASIVTFFPGLTLALLLTFAKKGSRVANLFLSSTVVVIVLKTGGLTSLLLPALGPLLYFYVRQLTLPDLQFQQKDLLNFSTLLATYWIPPWLTLMPFIIYLYLSHRLIQEFYKRLQPVLMDRPRVAFRILENAMLLLGLFCILSLFNDTFYFAIAFVLIGMAAEAILKPDNDVKLTLPVTDRSDAREKGRRLKEAVATNRYYEDAGLTLTTLAVKLNMHPHDLSRIINIGLGKNFSDLINDFRVREIARKMRDPAYDRLTQLGIAYESGFNSERTFHRVFKEMTGKTPLEYKNSLRKVLPIDQLATPSRMRPVILASESPPNWAPEKLNRNIMIKNYFKTAWRHILRNKGYTALNTGGLSIGIAACMVIFVIVHYELSYDTFQPAYKNIYHVVTRIRQADGITYSPGTADPASAALRMDFPQAKVAALESNYGGQVIVPSGHGNLAGDKKFVEYTGMVFIEPEFFDIFKWNWLRGSASVLKDPDMVVLNKSTAIKYFGDWNNALGKIIKMDNLLTLKVAGIVEDAPHNTDLPLRIMVSYATWKERPNDYGYATNWYSTNPYHQVFLSLPSNAAIDNVNAQLISFSKKYFTNRTSQTYTLFLQPLANLHFDTRLDNTFGDHITSPANLRTLGLIGLLIILMAAINFINLSTAQSVGRSKEVGVRKVLGSSRLQLMMQVMGETTIIVVCSVIMALIIAELTLPYLKNIASVPPDISLLNTGTLVFLSVTTVSIIILSGLYPAIVVSGFKPVLALKNKITSATVGGIPLRRTLVVAQFAISQLLIIGTIAAVSQISYINNADLGFDKNAVLIIFGPSGSTALQRMKIVKQQLLQNPQVRSASLVTDAPSSSIEWASNFYFDHTGTPADFQAYLKEGDADYFKTFGFHFDAGAGYAPGDSTNQVVINETMAHRLGFQQPQDIIGKTIKLGGTRWSSITGVVRDFKAKSLRETIQPMIIFPNDKIALEMAVKIKTTDIRHTVAAIQKTWGAFYPEFACSYYFVDADIALFYKQDNQLALIYKIFAGLAIFISCLGLYGLISFMALQRTREVGIRKVLGASVSSIVYLFSKEFILLIVLSFFIAAPVAWYFIHSWLQGFAYRINLSVWIFVSAATASIVIAWLTVGYKSIKAALANPVKSLRTE